LICAGFGEAAAFRRAFSGEEAGTQRQEASVVAPDPEQMIVQNPKNATFDKVLVPRTETTYLLQTQLSFDSAPGRYVPQKYFSSTDLESTAFRSSSSACKYFTNEKECQKSGECLGTSYLSCTTCCGFEYCIGTLCLGCMQCGFLMCAPTL
jgi:hypothetical protein